MFKIIDYNNGFLKQVKDVFFLNVPHYFDESEWNDLKKYLKCHGNTYYILYNKEKEDIIGCGGYHICSTETIRLSWDFIDPNYKGKGYGSKLVKHSLKNALEKNKDIKVIEVYTSQHAYKFYERFNLRLCGKIENFWAKDFDLYKMQKMI